MAAGDAIAAADAKHCPGCAGSGAIRFRLAAYEIHRCRSCGTEYNASFSGGGGDGQLFSRDYFEVQHREAFAAQFDDYRNDPSLPVFRRRLDQIESLIGIGSVLDIGPGLGAFVRLASDRGWRAEGVEVSAFAADFIRRQHGLPVFTGDLVAFAETSSRSYDLITFWDSVEHVSHPLEALQAARRLLRPGGLLVIATDNFDCLVADLAAAFYRLSGGRWRYPVERVFIDRNRTYFTERSLHGLLERLQLQVVRFQKMEYPLRKIRTNTAERLVLAGLYGLARVTRRQAQMTIFARP